MNDMIQFTVNIMSPYMNYELYYITYMNYTILLTVDGIIPATINGIISHTIDGVISPTIN